jgi:hypothetical protein
MKNRSMLIAVSCSLSLFPAGGAVRYVNTSNSSPSPPYTNWASAAANIQNALDVAGPGDQIFVTNGTYQFATGVTSDGATNRAAVTNALTLQSVNGPAVTSILGGAGVRCVYLTDGAVLSGFTLTNGNANNGGGIYCTSPNALVSNCWLRNNSANTGGGAYSGTFTNCRFVANTCVLTGGNGGGAYGAILNNCTLSNNVTGSTLNSGATAGGGASGSVLNGCILSGNQARGAGAAGGGGYNSVLNNCTVLNGYADFDGGGTHNCNLTNCTLMNNVSVSGGGGATGGVLYQCGLYWNRVSGSGGGAYWYSTLYNCILTNNSAGYGGGETQCTLYNCVLFNNTGEGYGGGGYYGTLINCTVASNTSGTGGGAYNCTVDNSILYYNVGTGGGANDSSCSLNYCCDPTATGGRNITNAPLFVALASGNLRLQSNSPCINSGRNSYAATCPDPDGNPRIAGGTVDMGAYEYPSPTSLISYAWLQQYGLPLDGSADNADYDGTGMTEYQDWIAGLNPTNSSSVLAMTSAVPTNNPSGWVVTWQSVSGITYYLQSSTNLGGLPAFSTIQSNLAGQSGTTRYTDTTATNSDSYFYRVGVQ